MGLNPTENFIMLINLIGQKFGRLTPAKWIEGKWLCKCDCGEEISLSRRSLRRKHAPSCGCLPKCYSLIRDGRSFHPIYSNYKNMMARCHNVLNRDYPDWGGKGIKVCDRWRYNFWNFVADMGLPPKSKGYSLDRIDNKGDYEPGNVRWATCAEQNRHLSTNRFLTFRGETKIITDWAREFHLRTGTVRKRLLRYGWSIEDALLKPVKVYNNVHVS
jgi:hypothetical protein